MPTYELALRRTTIADPRTKDDYAVIWTSLEWGRRYVGRIRRANERDGFSEAVWLYYVQPVTPIGTEGEGHAGSLKEAQAKFRAAFERYCDGIGALVNQAFPAGRGNGGSR